MNIFFDNILELIQHLEDTGTIEYKPICLKKLITLTMDSKNRGKEIAPTLSVIHINFFPTKDAVHDLSCFLIS